MSEIKPYRRGAVLNNPIKNFWRAVTKTENCWLWRKTKHGYGSLSVKGKPMRAHRFSWMIHNGPIESDLCVLHKCDNPRCVNPDHLFLGTRHENNKDRDMKHRTKVPVGANNGNAKLTESDVRTIRNKLDDGNSLASIGKEYGVTWQTIQAIKNRKTWDHLS